MDLELSGTGLTLPAVDFQKSESEPAAVVQKFDDLYQAELQRQIDEGGGRERPEYPRGRALKVTLRSTDFLGKMPWQNGEAQDMVNHLLEDSRYSHDFTDFIRKRGSEFRHLSVPANLAQIYSIAVQEIAKREGKA
jgi:hypothetical protein